MLKSESSNSLLSLGSSEKHIRVVERLLNNHVPEDDNKVRMTTSQLSRYSDRSADKKIDVKSVSSKKSIIKINKSAELIRTKNSSKLSKTSNLAINNENDDQQRNLQLLEKSIYNGENQSNKENTSRKSSLIKSKIKIESESSLSDESNSYEEKKYQSENENSLKNIKNLERDELRILDSENLKLLNDNKSKINNRIAEFTSKDLDEWDNNKIKLKSAFLNDAPLINDLDPRYENTKMRVIRPPSPKPKQNPPEKPNIRSTLKSANRFSKIKYDLQERHTIEEYEKKLKEINESKSFTIEEEEKSVLRLSRLPNRLKSINLDYYKIETIHDDPKLKNIDINAVSRRLYKVKVKKQPENKQVRKINTEEQMDIIFKRLSSKSFIGPPDSNRTIKESPFKNSDLINSHAWKGYN